MLTPDDLKAIEQLFDKKLDEKLEDQAKVIDEKLEKQTKAILEGVADFASDALVPLLDKHEKHLEHLEKHTVHPPGQAANT